jgi:hypothetical protein
MATPLRGCSAPRRLSPSIKSWQSSRRAFVNIRRGIYRLGVVRSNCSFEALVDLHYQAGQLVLGANVACEVAVSEEIRPSSRVIVSDYHATEAPLHRPLTYVV